MRIRLKTDRLQRLLAASRLSQNHWALRMELSRGHWSDIVNGRHPYPSAKTRQRMLEVLGVPLEELFEIEQRAVTNEDTDFRAGIAERYLIDRELGQGAMGNVYLARDVARGRVVALKTISREAASGIGARALLREIAASAQLHHPNILPLYDSGVVADHAFLVMPWVREGSLRDRLRRETRLAPETVARIAHGLGAGLAYAHGERVLHCDIKPENILLQGDHAWLSDFGISRVLHAEFSEYRARDVLNTSAGTPAYVSPEQVSGEGRIDGRSDTYSLGCVVYEMLTGSPPFEGTSTLDVVSRRFVSPPPDLSIVAPDVPHAMAEAVSRAMALKPDHRYASADAFAGSLGETARSRAGKGSPWWGRLVRSGRALQAATARAMSHRAGDGVRGVLQDLRHAWRGLRRAPRFLLATVMPLALGVGAGITFLNIVDHLMFRPPPAVVDAERVVRFVIDQPGPDGRPQITNSLAWIDLEALQRSSSASGEIAGYFTSATSYGTGEHAAPITVTLASPSFFRALGVRPAAGRFFTQDEDVRGARETACVMSDRMARTRGGAVSDMLGTRVVVGRVTCNIVGIAPRGFRGIDLREVDLWMPVQVGAPDRIGTAPEVWTTDGSHWLRIVARLKPGMSIAGATDDATRAYRTVTVRRRDTKLEAMFRPEPVQLARGSLKSNAATQAVLLSAGAVGLLLLIIANLLNAFIARDLGRAREMAIRTALGGGRLRLLRAHAMESVLIAGMAAGLALLIARWLGPPVQRILFPAASGWSPEPVDARVALLAFGLAQGAGLLVSVLMAWHSRSRDTGRLLRVAGASSARRSARARTILVGLQAAVSFALLAASVAFVRSFHGASNVDLGFTVDGLITIQAPLGTLQYTSTQERDFYRALHERVAALPGVESASIGYTNPWWNDRTEAVFSVTGDSMPVVPQRGDPLFDAVTPDYLNTMRLTMHEGRWISPHDGVGSEPVIVVNEALARHYWPTERRVLGKCLRIGADSLPCRTIVGVTRSHRVVGALDAPLMPTYFLPEAQADAYGVSPSLFVRSSGSEESLMPALRRLTQTFVPGLPLVEVGKVRDHLEPMLAPWRLGAIAFTALGTVAIVVALVGLYAVLAFLVAERRQEFAIRAAIGGSHRQIARPVTRQALLTVAVGLLSGVILLIVAAPRIQPVLFQVSLIDPLALAGVVLAVGALAWWAAAGPARRAAREDPMNALRGD